MSNKVTGTLASAYLERLKSGKCKDEARMLSECVAEQGRTLESCLRYQQMFSRCVVDEWCPSEVDEAVKCNDLNRTRGGRDFVRQECRPVDQKLVKCTDARINSLLQ